MQEVAGSKPADRTRKERSGDRKWSSGDSNLFLVVRDKTCADSLAVVHRRSLLGAGDDRSDRETLMRKVLGYMCKVDFDHELGNALDGVPVYSSVWDLKKNRPCVDECGIVEVVVEFSKVVEQGKF